MKNLFGESFIIQYLRNESFVSPWITRKLKKIVLCSVFGFLLMFYQQMSLSSFIISDGSYSFISIDGENKRL